MTKSGIKQLVRLFDHKCGKLKAARNMKCTHFLVNWALKIKTSVRKRNQRFQSKINDFVGYADKYLQNLKIMFGFLTMNLILLQLTSKSAETIISTLVGRETSPLDVSRPHITPSGFAT